MPSVKVIPVQENESQIFVGDVKAMSEEAPSPQLTLYTDPPSYYGQKVVLTLHEKQIPFATRKVDLFASENYEDWYLKLNPRGEVPVIQDGPLVIPDSKRIIDYLEEKYSSDGFIPLTPLDLGESEAKTLKELREKIDAIDGNLMAYGTLYHEEHVQNPKFPFSIGFVRQKLKDMVNTMGSRLRALAENRPNVKDVLIEKAANADRILGVVSDKNNYQLELNKVASLLELVERQLMNRTPEMADRWLCSERYTQADVSLTVLLYRLSIVGLEEYLWGSLPHINEYYRRVQERPSFAKTFPTLGSFVWDKVLENKFLITGGLTAVTGAILILVHFI